jgi:Zn-finger nucleic acid-binding protein
MNATASPIVQSTSAALRCPKCHGEMTTYERSGVVIDQCRDCRGMFLDRGELERLVDAESGGTGWTGPRMRPPAPAPLPVPGGDPFRDRVIDPRAAYRSEWHVDDDRTGRGGTRSNGRAKGLDHDGARRRAPSRNGLVGEPLKGLGD